MIKAISSQAQGHPSESAAPATPFNHRQLIVRLIASAEGHGIFNMRLHRRPLFSRLY